MAVAEEMVGMQAAAGGWMEQSAATGQLLPTPLPSQCPSLAHPEGWEHSEGDTDGPKSICDSCQGCLAWQYLGMLPRGIPSIPSPWCCPSTTEAPAPAAELETSHSSLGGHSHHHHSPGTHNVRSLGMWLKLDTGIEVILLLFRVLQEDKEGHVRADRL